MSRFTTFLFNTVLEKPANAIREEKEIKRLSWMDKITVGRLFNKLLGFVSTYVEELDYKTVLCRS